ncbi:MAG: HAMP domain-containing sensor histidine kinase [bacterium]
MLQQFIHVQYCYDYLVNQIPIGLLFYTHLTVAIASLVVGTFLLIKTRTLASITLFLVCLSFVGWVILDLSEWFSFLGAGNTMATWELAFPFTLIFFFFAYYFLYTFATNRDLPLWQKIASLIVMAPTFVYAFLGKTLTMYDGNTCESLENGSVTNYYYIAQGVFFIAAIVFTIYKIKKNKDSLKKKEIFFAGLGVILFMSFFLFTDLAVNMLVDSNAVEYAYNFGIYGLLGMPLLLGFLVYLIVKFKTFNVKLLAAQALMWTIGLLVGAQLFFIKTTTNFVLTSITLVITVIAGYVLVKSVEKVDEQKIALGEANEAQQGLIRFITHQVKGFFTKSKMIFASVLEGDMGPVSDDLKHLVQQGMDSDNQAVDMIQGILSASSLKTGKTDFVFEKIDFVKFAKDIAEKYISRAKDKGLDLQINLPEQEIFANIDKTQFEQVIKNLVDNAVNYTQTGSVIISLSRQMHEDDGRKIIFSVKDSGVGLSGKDKSSLFHEGGRGEESIRYNVNSTGYGLYIVKKIVEKHHGYIWAESAGRDQGSTFIFEIPEFQNK